MHVVYYVGGWPPSSYPNGVVTAVARLAPALRAAGCAVSVTPAKMADNTPPANGVAPLSPQRGASRFDPMRAVRRRLAGEAAIFEETPRLILRRMRENPALRQADIYEIEESFGWSRLLNAKLPQPVVTRLHGPFFLTGGAATDSVFSSAQKERIRREGEAIKSAEALSAPSKFVLNAVREKYSLPLEEAAVIPNPAPGVYEKDFWRHQDTDENEILFVGRFDRIKGADVLLRAFARLAAERPTLKLTFAGPTAGEINVDGRACDRDSFLQAIAPPDIASRVSFLGAQSQDALALLRKRAALTVVSSRFENFPNVLLEALACGAPAVATRTGGIPEIARDGEEIVLVEPGDAEGLSCAIASLLDSPDRRAQLAANGRKRVREVFSSASIAAQTVAFYEETIRKRTGANASGVA